VRTFKRIQRAKRLLALAVVAALMGVLPATPAYANHNTCELDLTPETSTGTLGTQHTVTASLRPAGTDPNTNSTATCTTRTAGGSVDVLFEVTSNDANATYSPGTVDRQNTPLQPDLGCTIPSNANSCTVTYTRTAATGTDTITGWIADEEAVDDAVTRTWTAAQASLLNVEPESDSNPPQTAHTLTATVRDSAGNAVAGVNVDFEVVAGPNQDLNTTRADLECATGANGTCTVNYTDEANNPASPNNVDTICAWLDPENDDVYAPFGSIAADGGDCDQEPVGESEDSPVAGGDTFGNDSTDTVTKTWAPPTLTFSPSSDTASVGTCNAFTITLGNGAGQGTAGVNIDVEQIHSTATNTTAGDEPTVSFCTPVAGSGPNISAVDTTRGDRVENPDNPGTAGGETTAQTDANGQVTIGISVAAGGTSNGTGTVTLTGWREAGADNDDPEAGETQGTATKNWVAAEPRSVDCDPETSTLELGGTATISCLVRDRFGAPLAGQAVVFTSTGPGRITSATRVLTDANGRASVSTASFQVGTQSVLATLETDLLGTEPTEVDDCDRVVGDPAGAPAGDCSDTVTVAWTLPTTGTPVPEVCRTTPGAFIGTDGDDVIVGTSGNDVICGRGGNDRLAGGAGSDRLLGGAGGDTLLGGEGADRLGGGADADTLSGGDGADLLSGGDGGDYLQGKSGNDTLRGGADGDLLQGGRGHDLLNGGDGRDQCSGGPGRNRERSC
jgi:Ca2+-binding RTX toxin-like protein